MEGAIAKAQLDDATMTLNVARANVETQQQLLDRLLAGVADTGATDSLNLPTIVQERASAENIQNDIAAQGDFDLIVMGNRGFGGFDAETFGSVAKFVQENSSKPLIFAKGMPGDWDEENNFIGGEDTWR